MKVITYIDGLNLYHSIKDLNDNSLQYLKWQNLISLSKQFLSRNDTIEQIYFFSAYPHWKQNAMQRHKQYVAILQDLGINVILGRFKEKQVYCTNCKLNIKKHEEKETDVNIAIQIVRDCYEEQCDMMQIISGDTDLLPPIKFAKNKGLKINIVIPPHRRANELFAIADKKSNIKVKHLQKSFIGSQYKMQNDTIMRCPYMMHS